MRVRWASSQSVGQSERRVFALVNGYRDVRKLIDLSCLGEFETCKALCNLVNLGYVNALMPVGEPDLPEDDIGLGDRVRGALGRLAVSMVVLAGIVGVLLGTQLNPWAVQSSTGAGFAEGVLRQQIHPGPGEPHRGRPGGVPAGAGRGPDLPGRAGGAGASVVHRPAIPLAGPLLLPPRGPPGVHPPAALALAFPAAAEPAPRAH